VRPAFVKPEHGRIAGGPGATDGELDPVPNRHVLGLAHAKDVAFADRLFENHPAGVVDDPHGAD
jgi:hypothetical protein